MDAALAPPRALTDEETSSLRELLRSELITISSSADDEDDAEALLDYAADLIEEGENVGHVVEELEMMEMPVCDGDAARKLGEALTEFFLDLDGGALRGTKKKGASKWKTVETAAPSTKPSPPPSPSAPKWTKPAAPAPTLVKESPPPPPTASKWSKPAPPARASSCASTAASTSASVSTAGEENASEADAAPVESVEEATTTPTLSVAARLSSYGTACCSPAAPSSLSPASADRRSYGGRSWAAKENEVAVAEITKNPASAGDGDSKPEPETEPETEPEPKRASLKDRLAAYQGASSSPSNTKPSWAAKEKKASVSSYGGRSWAAKEKKEAVPEIAMDPASPSDRESEPETEPEPTPKRSSLKDRLAAYQQGASSSSKKALPQKHKNDSWLRDRLRAQSSLEESIKEDENEDDDDDGERIVDFTPVLSLRERMAAFQGGEGSAIPISQAGM